MISIFSKGILQFYASIAFRFLLYLTYQTMCIIGSLYFVKEFLWTLEGIIKGFRKKYRWSWNSKGL